MAVGEGPVKQAIRWLDDQLQDDPGRNRSQLVDEASRRFNLSPMDAEFLFRFLAERSKGTQQPDQE